MQNIQLAYSCLLTIRLAKILGALQSINSDECEKAEKQLLNLYRIEDSALSANEARLRPDLIMTLEQLSEEYLNILRFDPQYSEKLGSFILVEKTNVFSDTPYGKGHISSQNLTYAKSALERNKRVLGVLDDGFPSVMNGYQDEFYKFLNLPVVSNGTLVIAPCDCTVSKSIVNGLMKSKQKASAAGMTLFKANTVTSSIIETYRNLFYSKNRLYLF